jgi:hypothetical protein
MSVYGFSNSNTTISGMSIMPSVSNTLTPSASHSYTTRVYGVSNSNTTISGMSIMPSVSNKLTSSASHSCTTRVYGIVHVLNQL